MQNDEVLQATLLLTSYFNKNEVSKFKPLTPTEYARFAAWLHREGLSPASLFNDRKSVLSEWNDSKNKITAERIESLFTRGASMAFAIEHWAKLGVWAISRGSSVYPKMIKEKLGNTCPAIFFGIGNQELLNKKAIGFVGSRSIDAVDESFAKSKAELAVSQDYVVVSGGAKGIDQTAMLSALAHGGESVGILSDSLLSEAATKNYRKGLKEGKLVLISPFYPEARFHVGNAMARNKYIYTMSESVVVVRSDFNKGGTWTGAKENLRQCWTPVLVRSSENKGNQELIELGALPIDNNFNDFNHLPEKSETDLKNSSSDPVRKMSAIQQTESLSLFEECVEPNSLTFNKKEGAIDLFNKYGDIFHMFFDSVKKICIENKTVQNKQLLQAYPELNSNIIGRWLNDLVEEGYLIKEGRKDFKLVE